MKSSMSMANDLTSSSRSGAGKPDMFKSKVQDQMQEARRQVAVLSKQLDHESLAIKKFLRNTLRQQDAGGNNRLSKHISIFLNKLPATERLEEEDV